jgi:hypothetical protein
MDLTGLPFDQRVIGVRLALHQTHTSIANALKEEVEFVQSAVQQIEHTLLPPKMKSALLNKTGKEKLEIANQHADKLQELWVTTVTEARSCWGNDAVDAVLQELAKRP